MDMFVGLTSIVAKMKHLVQTMHKFMDSDCTQTTRTVIGLLDSVQLLRKGHIVYLDNFYNSYQLNLELYARDTFVCGMLRSNRKGNSKAVVTAKLKKGEAVFRTNGPVLCLKWCEKKRSVTMMSTVHSAVYVEVKKRHSDDKIRKPLAVYDYTQKMAGVDKHDQFKHLLQSTKEEKFKVDNKNVFSFVVNVHDKCIHTVHKLWSKWN